MKKNSILYIFTFLLAVVSYLPNTFAQEISSIRTFRGHTSYVDSVAFSPDGTLLASGSSDETIRLWDVATGEHIRTLTGPSPVESVLFSPDGSILASGHYDGSIRLWDVATGTLKNTLMGHTGRVYSVAFSPDGKTLATGGGWNDNTIRLWDVATGALKDTLTGHTGSVLRVAFSPDGKTLASMDRGSIRLWDVATGEHIRTLTGPSPVESVFFSPDGSILASGDEPIHVWNRTTGRKIELWGHTDRINSVSFSPDGSILAGGDNRTIHLWNVKRGGKSIGTLIGHTWVVKSVAFSPDGSILASGSADKTIRLWDVETLSDPPFEGHTGRVESVAFSPDGMLFASGGADSIIGLWDVATGEELRTLWGHTGRVDSVAFSPDGNTLASGSGDSTIGLWDVATGEELRTLWGHTWTVKSVAFSPDGSILASGSGDGTIRVWDVATGEHIRTLWEHTDEVWSVAFSPDGKTLASAHYHSYGVGYGSDSVIHLLDVTTGEVLNSFRLSSSRFSSDIFRSVAFSPDGHILAGGGRKGIQFWDVTTGEPTLRLIGHTTTVASIAFSPDGTMLASGHSDGSIGVWDTRTGKRMSTLEGHTGVGSVAFSPDGSKLVSGGSVDEVAGGDVVGTPIRLWRLPNTRIRLTPIPVVSPAIGEQFTINVSIVSGENVGGYQMRIVFDPTALRYVESANGEYLPPGVFFVPPVVSSNAVTLGATSLSGVSNGDGTLATVTFEVLDVKESVIDLFDVIITDSAGEHLPQLPHIPTKVIEPTLLPTDAIISLTPSAVLSPAIGERLTFNIDITGGQNVKDFWIMVDFDKSALKFLTWRVGGSPYLSNGIANGDGILETITFEVVDVKASTLDISGYLIAENGLRYKPTFEEAEVIIPLLGDVNRDGSVNILDLVLVASKFGQRVSGDPADVNEDGVINIVDLVKVAGALGGEAAAPSTWHLDVEGTFTRGQVQQWLSEARELSLTDATSQHGILFLEQLLAALTPKETSLLPNYPNPFNPETWIPYQLAAPTDVKISIYAADGKLIRTLALGHQPVGIYESKNRAAYWDGRNQFGEPVASGVYFYTLTAGEFTATRKMLIRK